MGIPLRVGIIGVGNISTQYLTHIPKLPSLKLIALADLDMARAAEVAATVGKVDSDVVAHTESPLDEFGRMKAVVVGSP